MEFTYTFYKIQFNMHGTSAEAIGTAFCLLADILSEMLLSHYSGKGVQRAFQGKIIAFLGENIPILS
jgi:hypothetical protein